ncbi:MAG: type II toxin-antitoxin system HicB family antitoxin [Armatimonadetes bacterium]|nr:type II toxin-antitoxin system HicB family antitoxin [Armatimonadota bacterium]MCX7969122.1 type II toxin-antitoxin system HicB family antitoxin [Armatimonadota bacterium]MDW8142229.1 type II toxin-antitoxin system HicB family antitoxin [Armatimonadota bacterium]
MAQVFRLPIVIEQDENGVFIVECPVIQGCHSYGYTLEEALKNIEEAIQLCIEERLMHGEPPLSADWREVEVLVKVETYSPR